MDNYEIKCESQYDDNVNDYRAISKFVWYQIRHMIKNDLQLGRIIKIDDFGILSVNENSRLLTAEEKIIIKRLIANDRDGIYRKHRFKDLDKKINSKKKYNEWFDEKAMNSFMQTIPTKEIFYNELVSLYYKIKDTHSNQ